MTEEEKKTEQIQEQDIEQTQGHNPGHDIKQTQGPDMEQAPEQSSKNVDKASFISKEEKLRDEISKDFDYNYFVSAGAGAGKTKLVVDRITNQLSSGKYKAEEIVAITFTNKAAQELAGRISKNLREKLSADPGNSNIKEALREIGRMQISTIHSFCHRILKENCFKAKLRMDFELLEEKDAEELKAAFFENWFNDNAALFTELKEKCPINIGYGHLEDNFKNVCDLPDNVVFRYEKAGDPVFSTVGQLEADIDSLKQKVYREFILAVEDELKYDRGIGSPLVGKKFSDEDTQKYLKDEFKGLDYDAFAEKLISGGCIFRSSGGAALGFSIPKTLKQELIDINNEALNKVQGSIDGILEKKQRITDIENALVNTLVLDFVLAARKAYRQQKFNHYLSNDLLLQRADLLLDDAEVVGKLRGMFKCIYLDESQDTDPVQNELIMKICKDGDEFVPGMMFIVGDVKQSIYRFRDADYRIFNAVKKDFEDHPATCKVVSLNLNNRSNNDLVDYFNEKVEGLPAGLIPDYEPMIARNDYRDDNVIHGTYRIEKPDKGYIDEKAVIEIIKYLVGTHSICLYDPDKQETVVRPIEYKDFLVLTPNAKQMDNYIDAFQTAGIPVRASVQYVPGSMYPLKRFAAIYRYLAMPYYKRAKEGALGIAQDSTSCQISENIDRLNEWRKEISHLSGAEMVGWLLEHGELYLYEKDPVPGNMVKRYQMAIRQMVDQVLSGCDNDAVSISEALLEYVGEDNCCDREIGYDKEENAVRFMNIHKAKGLEGNIVIIAQRRSEKDGGNSTYTEGNDRYQTVKKAITPFSSDLYPAYVLNDTIKEKAINEQKKEDARLEYVAVTRAKEALIFMGELSKVHPAFENYVDEDMPKLFELPVDEKKADESGETAGERSLIHAKLPADDLNKEKRYKVSPSTMERPKAYVPPKPQEDIKENIKEGIKEGRNEELNEGLKQGLKEELREESKKEITVDVDDAFEDDKDETGAFELVTESASVTQRRPSGDIFGTVMHRTFELAVKEIMKDAEDWALCINRAINENSDDIDVRYMSSADDTKNEFQKYLTEKLPAFVDAIKPEIISADEVNTEYPFSLTVTGDELKDIKKRLYLSGKIADRLPKDGEEDTCTVWINGKADLVLRKGSNIVIWDYKSDKDVTADDIHDKYDNQMELYKWVFAKCLKVKTEGRFYSLELGSI